MKKMIQMMIYTIAAAMYCSGFALAGDVSIPNSFTAGTPAVASEVNENFAVIEAEVNDNDARITENALDIEAKQDRVTGTCPTGQSIRVINSDGSVECEVDNSGSPPMPRVVSTVVEVTNLDATLTQSVGSVDLTTLISSGDAVVRFDGMIFVDPGARVILAASDEIGYGTNSDHIEVNGVGSTMIGYPFSHTRVYPVSADTITTFYAVVDHFSGGSSNVSIYGTLTVEYFPDKW